MYLTVDLVNRYLDLLPLEPEIQQRLHVVLHLVTLRERLETNLQI